ncbi:YdeI family protein [Virgibacillus siamensis]|uniref:YdeI family protein n=1 Tax=Virgibacillus siamensis TaxID=480071 RepID=A0ABN1FS01_9BACI
MANSRTNSKVEAYLRNVEKWQEEMEELRNSILDCGLTEELKWKKPCYTFQNNNIAIIQGFKKYVALMFFKGSLLKDPNEVLVKPGENSQAQRQIRFTNVQEIEEMKTSLKAYINEAIEVEKAGLEVPFKKNKELVIPEELKNKFDETPDLKTAFEKLTPGRQRAYIIFISKAKQSKTRTSRVEKYTQKILDGKGLND